VYDLTLKPPGQGRIALGSPRQKCNIGSTYPHNVSHTRSKVVVAVHGRFAVIATTAAGGQEILPHPTITPTWPTTRPPTSRMRCERMSWL